MYAWERVFLTMGHCIQMSDKASIITLNCLIPGEEVSFDIKISTTNQVSILADKIRNRRLDLFKDTDSSKLILYINQGTGTVVMSGAKYHMIYK